MRGLDGIIDSMDISLSKIREMVKNGKPGVLQSMGSQRTGHDGVTEQKQYIYPLFCIPSHLGHHSALSRVPCAIE